MTTSTTTLKTRTKAPFVIVYTGPKGAAIVGYAYTTAAATKRARKLGRAYTVLPVVGGTVTVPTPTAPTTPVVPAGHVLMPGLFPGTAPAVVPLITIPEVK